MADFSKVKRGTLGAPPPMTEASPNLEAPEVAPAPPVADIEPDSEPVRQTPRFARAPSRIDGRTLRRTSRTIAFATRVNPDFDMRVRQIAQREGILIVQVLERALDAYEASKK